MRFRTCVRAAMFRVACIHTCETLQEERSRAKDEDREDCWWKETGDGERERERKREKRKKRREKEREGVHADTREITAFAYVWIHRSSERASASGRPGFIGLLQAWRGMAARWRKRER